MRVNLINPIFLTDQHLIAELNEINMITQAFYRSYRSKNGIHSIPKKFTLNTGHVKFFYDKGLYLHKRYNALKQEALKRGFNIREIFKNYFYWIDEKYCNDWKEREEDKEIIKERIQQKISLKPEWYRYYRKPLQNYNQLLKCA